jgi:hypothetical protein
MFVFDANNACCNEGKRVAKLHFASFVVTPFCAWEDIQMKRMPTIPVLTSASVIFSPKLGYRY